MLHLLFECFPPFWVIARRSWKPSLANPLAH